MQNARVVILAAGQGTRMQEAFPGVPKPLVPVGNEPLLLRTLRQLHEVGLDDVIVVTGHRGDELRAAALNSFPNTAFITNPRYAEDRNIYSLLCGLAAGCRPTLVIEGDVVFSGSALLRLAASLQDVSLWCVCGKFSPDQLGGIIAADAMGNILEISYVNAYAPALSEYWKNLGALYIAGRQMAQYLKLLREYARKTLDQYFLTPWAEHLAELPARIFDLGRDGAASFNSCAEYDAAMARLGITSDGGRLPWVMVDVGSLRHIERFDLERVEWLAGKIAAEGVWTVPLVVDDEHGLVMDGQHRMEVALRLGLRRVPAVKLPYQAVNVYSLRPADYSVTVEEIVGRALSGDIYPYKTAKHRLPGEIGACAIPLSELY